MAYTTEGEFTTDANGSVIGVVIGAEPPSPPLPPPTGLYLSLIEGETVAGITEWTFELSEPAPEDTWIWFHTTSPSDVETATVIEGMGQSVVVQIPATAGDVVLDGAMLANQRTPVAIGDADEPVEEDPEEESVEVTLPAIHGQRGPVTTWREESWRFQAASGQIYKNIAADGFGNGLIKVRQAYPIDGTGARTPDGYCLVIENIIADNGYRVFESETSVRDFRFSDIKATRVERGLLRLKSDPSRGMFCGGTAQKPAIIERVDVDCGGEALYRERQAFDPSLVKGWFPVGMDFTHSGHIIVRDCTIKGAWTAPQEETGEYQNGDCALTENQSHNIKFERVHVSGAGDAGFDIKGSRHRLDDCSADACKSSIKWWGAVDMNNPTDIARAGSVGAFTSRNPRLEHVAVVGGWVDPATGQEWRTRFEIEKLIIEGSDPTKPIIRLDGTSTGVDVVIHDWEIIGMNPADVVATWKTGDGIDTVDWGPKGPPSTINL